jgi:hypothetical protein
LDDDRQRANLVGLRALLEHSQVVLSIFFLFNLFSVCFLVGSCPLLRLDIQIRTDFQPVDLLLHVLGLLFQFALSLLFCFHFGVFIN